MNTRPIAEVYAALAQRLELPKEFVCPKCGGDCFGTVNPTRLDTEPQILECHGYGTLHGDTGGCRWTGPWTEVSPPDLACWAGVGLVVEAMRGRGWEVYLQGWPSGEWISDFFHVAYEGEHECATPWEAVCRAALAALEAE